MMQRLSGAAGWVIVVALVAVAGLLVLLPGPAGTRITAYFNVAIGVYSGSEVRILGVPVGAVDEVKPEGTKVKVTLTVDHGVKIPAEVKAVVVSPTIVADRYVQLTPAYTGGPVAAEGTVIPLENTRTPVELDQIYKSMTELATEMGPEGVNKDGALSEAMRVAAENLGGNGQEIRTAFEEFAKASQTLVGSKDDLFGTVKNLAKFTDMLKNNDGQVRRAERQLSDVAGFLAEDRDELAAALGSLSVALGKMEKFITDNRAGITKNVNQLASVTQVLVDQRKSLAEALDVMPLDVINLLNAYDPKTKTLMGRGNLLELATGMKRIAHRAACPENGPASPACANAKKAKPVKQGTAAALPLPLPSVGPVYSSAEAS